MKTFLLFFFLLLAPIFVYCQSNHFPKGAYMSFDEILERAPSRQLDLKLLRRTQGDIKMNGGNDFKLESEDNSISKKTIKKEIWAYSFGDTLYVNCKKYMMQTWYAPLISDGEYLVIKAGLSNYIEEQKKQRNIGYTFGALGGGIQGAQLATLRFLYVIDKKTKVAQTVIDERMPDILKTREDLLKEFNMETEMTEGDCVQYLRRLNGEI
jgi:hypothetical protein